MSQVSPSTRSAAKLSPSPPEHILVDPSITSPVPTPSHTPSLSPHSPALNIRTDRSSIIRRRRDVRAARDRLSDQFDQLRRVLPSPPDGVELTAKAHVLEHSLNVIQSLMHRATFLAMELAVVSPDATRRWVRVCAQDGQKPLLHTVAAVMKLFAARTQWRYGEWWTLDECVVPSSRTAHSNAIDNGDKLHCDNDAMESTALDTDQSQMMVEGRENDMDTDEAERPVGVLDDPGNVHGCVVRDSTSVMKLAWTLVQRQNSDFHDGDPADVDSDEETKLTKFARASEKFEFRPRIGMPGRVWTSRRAEWLMDLKDRETFIRSRLAEEFGMQTCLAVPIQFGGHVHSVMAFYSRQYRPYDPDCFDLACILSKSLEEVYSPSNATPWQIGTDVLFPSQPR